GGTLRFDVAAGTCGWGGGDSERGRGALLGATDGVRGKRPAELFTAADRAGMAAFRGMMSRKPAPLLNLAFGAGKWMMVHAAGRRRKPSSNACSLPEAPAAGSFSLEPLAPREGRESESG